MAQRIATPLQRSAPGTFIPGESEFSPGPGMGVEGLRRYRGQEASETLAAAPESDRRGGFALTANREGWARR